MHSILTVNTQDHGGGAAKIARTLFEGYAARGHVSQMAVGIKRTNQPNIFSIHNNIGQSGVSGFFWKHSNRFKNNIYDKRGAWAMTQITEHLASPNRLLQRKQGRELVAFPGAFHLSEQVPKPVDLVHLHNLHGDYFDLHALPNISKKNPTVITLHDAWLIAGHCSHSFDCEKWLTGCGPCPDLSIPPAIEKDATAENWAEKKKIYEQSRFYFASPSRYLLDKAKQSILAEGMIEGRVIPNGIDLTVFFPGDKGKARQRLGIEQEAKVVVFAAEGTKKSPWRDFALMREAIVGAATNSGQRIIFLAIGEDLPSERISDSEIRYVPYLDDPASLVEYYRACDVYIHAAKAEVFSLVVAEAMACGAPVVATAVGGLPEVVDDEQTGFLVPSGDAEILSARISQLLTDTALAEKMGKAGAEKAGRDYNQDRMIDDYLSWFDEIKTTPLSKTAKK